MKQIVDKLNKIAKAVDENVEIPATDLITDSLDAITDAFGGTKTDSKLIVDKLDDIANCVHGGGGSSITLESLSVTSNGHHVAPSGVAYDEVDVNVASTWSKSMTITNGLVNYGNGTFSIRYLTSSGETITKTIQQGMSETIPTGKITYDGQEIVSMFFMIPNIARLLTMTGSHFSIATERTLFNSTDMLVYVRGRQDGHNTNITIGDPIM